MLCKCGTCGEDAGFDSGGAAREYRWGHKTKTLRPKEARKLCECGCLTPVKNRLVKGHIHKLTAEVKVSAPCECGCGEMTAPGVRFLRDHYQRTEAFRDSKSEMFKKMWSEAPEKFADRDVWNTGLTKETDERLARHSKWMVDSFTPEKIEHYRELGREAAKFLPHLTGPDASNWKGGITEFRKMGKGCGGRTGETLYTAWKKPILDAAGHRCEFCGIGRRELHADGHPAELHVHHSVERMATIIGKFTAGIPNVNELSWDERVDIWQNIIDYHVDAKVPGQVLCDECHMRAHRKNPDVD